MGLDPKKLPPSVQRLIAASQAKAPATAAEAEAAVAPVLLVLNTPPATVTHHDKQIARCGGRPRLIDSPRLKAARQLYLAHIWTRRLPPFPPPVMVAIALYFEAGKNQLSGWYVAKPDADNSAKAILDALVAAGYVEDDKHVSTLLVLKQADLYPRVEVYLRTLPPRIGGLAEFLNKWRMTED